MSDICDELRKKWLANKEEQRKINRDRLARAFGLDKEKFTPETIVDYMVNNFGANRQAMEAELNLATSTEEGSIAVKDLSEKVANRAMQNIQTEQGQSTTSRWRKAMNRFNELVNDAVNNRVPGMNSTLDAFTKTMAHSIQQVQIGKLKDGSAVFAGGNVGVQIKLDIEALQKSKEFAEASGNLSLDQTNMAMTMMGYMRGKEVPSTISRIRKSLESKMEASPWKKHWIPALDAAERAYASQEFRDYASKYFEKLDSARSAGIDLGIFSSKPLDSGEILPATKQDYYHNLVTIEQFRDPIEGVKSSHSDFTESKKYKDGVDFVIDGKIMPPSINFTEVASSYWKNFARAARIRMGADLLRENAKATGSERMVLEDAKGELSNAVFVRDYTQKDWKVPSDVFGNPYKNMESINALYSGIYVHPKLYKWLDAVIGKSPELGGFTSFLSRTNDMWRTAVLSFGYGKYSVHGMSLAQKTAFTGKAIGIENWWGLNSMQGIGLSAISENHPVFLRMIEGGLTLHPYDVSRGFTQPKFDAQGNLSFTSQFFGMLHKFTNFQHSELFQKWHAGLKVGLGIQATKTPWFKDMANRNGYEQAYKDLAKILNDTLGGQNLELMGRSKGMQLIMRSVLLAPDWQESKFRRIFGSVSSKNPEIRKVMMASIAWEAVMLGLTHIATQQFSDAMTGQQHTMDDILHEWAHGNLGIIKIGKTSDGKRDIKARLSVTGIEDNRPLMHMLNAYWGAWTGKDFTGEESEFGKMEWYKRANPLYPAKDILAQEVLFKSSPMLHSFLETMGAKPGKESPTAFVSFLPIPVQQEFLVQMGMYGDTDEEKLKWGSALMLSAFTGTPLEAKSNKKFKTIVIPDEEEPKRVGIR